MKKLIFITCFLNVLVMKAQETVEFQELEGVFDIKIIGNLTDTIIKYDEIINENFNYVIITDGNNQVKYSMGYVFNIQDEVATEVLEKIGLDITIYKEDVDYTHFKCSLFGAFSTEGDLKFLHYGIIPYGYDIIILFSIPMTKDNYENRKQLIEEIKSSLNSLRFNE